MRQPGWTSSTLKRQTTSWLRIRIQNYPKDFEPVSKEARAAGDSSSIHLRWHAHCRLHGPCWHRSTSSFMQQYGTKTMYLHNESWHVRRVEDVDLATQIAITARNCHGRRVVLAGCWRSECFNSSPHFIGRVNLTVQTTDRVVPSRHWSRSVT
ncbi:hypothetical protein H310_11274 [Aphanomyces invadans]|uniref:Uncharacterized protein n=1 Tax=Aphanomyces invadans TaxID=157072 RepID=A0A024TP76_9STRA|nr:hypothetical protein H310_11274 [Aphanomyces invadans]ETV95396.1 hypothetical protein H310_11274 [Aphanomyces invadans]|eukprot:XP_008876097.1 hypothetical protein H310_11274 [Aphanomyces invadans]